METRHTDSFHSWSSRMVTEVDLICRSKVPIIPDLDNVTSNIGHPADYDYDFIQERQIIADWNQYWEQKNFQECHTPVPLHSNVTQPPSPRVNSASPTVVSPVPTGPQNPVSGSSNEEVHPPKSSRILHSANETTQNLPMSASQLISGQILQPRKTDGMQSGTTNTTCETFHQAKRSATCGISSENQTDTCLYLRDFDNGPDDPFASVELKTINELEELKNVLLTVGSDSKPSVNPPTAVQLSQSEVNSQHTSLHRQAPVSMNSSVYTSYSSYNQVPRLVYSPLLNTAVTKHTAPPTHPSNSFSRSHLDENLMSPLRKTLSLSVPNLESPGPKDHHISLNHTSTQPVRHPLTSTGPVLSFGGKSSESTLRKNVPPSRSEDSQAQALLQWAQRAGFSEAKSLLLIQCKPNHSRFYSATLEEAIQLLTSQLKLVDLLILEHSPPRFKSTLSEQSAVVAASAFPNDLIRARQFAKVTMDLEQSGYPQELTRAFFLDSPMSSEASLAHLLASFPHPLITDPQTMRTTTPSPQPFCTPRQSR